MPGQTRQPRSRAVQTPLRVRSVPARRLGDLLGPGARLIGRSNPLAHTRGATMSLDDQRPAPFREQLEGWFSRNGVDAVLVGPDRYVFGAGDPADLLTVWTVHQLTGRAPAIAADD